MKLPWDNLTGLYRAAAIFATGLLISSGLCGLNTLLWGVAVTHSAGAPMLMMTAFVELAAMIICSVGLVVIILTLIVQTIWSNFSPPPDTRLFPPMDKEGKG